MMIVRGIDHFTIRTDKLEETKEFYIELLNLKDGARPGFKFAGYWLYLENQPVIHLVESAISDNDEVAKYLGRRKDIIGGSGSIDHLAFRIEGYASLLKKVQKHNWDFFERTVPDMQEHQLFFSDPNEITIELVFRDDEYQQWKKEQ